MIIYIITIYFPGRFPRILSMLQTLKIQWMKLYDRDPLYTQLVDKYAVRSFVAERIGEEYLIPCLGVWDRFEAIDFDTLPDQFVLKCTHDSGSVRVCRDKRELDMVALKKHFREALRDNQYYGGREWPYKKVKARIIAEKYMEDEATKELRDYKFFCFGGESKALRIDSERGTGDVKMDFFDRNLNHMPFMRNHENAAVMPTPPAHGIHTSP